MVGPQGFEPWTEGLKVLCSTAELRARRTVFQIGGGGVYVAEHERGRQRCCRPLCSDTFGVRRAGYFSVCQFQRGETP